MPSRASHLRLFLRRSPHLSLLPQIRYTSTTSTPSQPPKPTPRNATSPPKSSPPSSSATFNKPTFSTPLAKHLTEAMRVTGPIPLAQFMKQCLTSPDSGYYTTRHGEDSSIDPFGKSGDFITSPEISQMFGEMVGIWVVAEWIKQGRARERVQLVELGPGRGTLMDDVLRTVRQFKSLSNAIESIYLIEASPHLRAAQHKLLCPNSPLRETSTGFASMTKYDIPITWYHDLSLVPAKENKTPFTIAHEFFDALPIHAFQSNGREWRELMVAPAGDPALKTKGVYEAPKKGDPEFALVAAKAKTPHSIMLPEVSPRYRKLKHMENAIIEISPESFSIVEEIAGRIGYSHSGAALIIDYGPPDTIPVNSLRGIRKHQILKSPFEAPGEVDLSVDVDFGGLAERILEKSEDVEVHGPVEQAAWLEMMGLRERVQMLVKRAGKEVEEELVSQVGRLTDRGVNGMGKLYKVMAIVPERDGKAPVGFGGGIDA